MAQLKNCCLGGLKAGTERKEKTKISSMNSILSFLLFPYFNKSSLSRDIINPIILD
jgi:hypothetical protein